MTDVPEDDFGDTDQWIRKQNVHRALQHEYDQVPDTSSIHVTGWQGGIPQPEKRFIDGFRAGVAHCDKIISGFGWATAAGVCECDTFEPCGRGVCCMNEGHEGECQQ